MVTYCNNNKKIYISRAKHGKLVQCKVKWCGGSLGGVFCLKSAYLPSYDILLNLKHTIRVHC